MIAEDGRIDVSYEKPIIVMRMLGKSGGAEMLRAMAEIRERTAEWPFSVTLVDLSKQLEASSVEARKAVANAPPLLAPSRGTALFGAGFAMRTVATLLMGVMRLTQKTENVSKFFADEAEARAWLATLIVD